MSRSGFAAYSGSKLAAQDQSGGVQSTTVRELAARGFDDARPSHDHAVRAIALGADSASRLSRALSVWSRRPRRPAPSWSSGYVVTEDDPADGRRKRIRMTDLGARGDAGRRAHLRRTPQRVDPTEGLQAARPAGRAAGHRGWRLTRHERGSVTESPIAHLRQAVAPTSTIPADQAMRNMVSAARRSGSAIRGPAK